MSDFGHSCRARVLRSETRTQRRVYTRVCATAARRERDSTLEACGHVRRTGYPSYASRRTHTGHTSLLYTRELRTPRLLVSLSMSLSSPVHARSSVIIITRDVRRGTILDARNSGEIAMRESLFGASFPVISRGRWDGGGAREARERNETKRGGLAPLSKRNAFRCSRCCFARGTFN